MHLVGLLVADLCFNNWRTREFGGHLYLKFSDIKEGDEFRFYAANVDIAVSTIKKAENSLASLSKEKRRNVFGRLISACYSCDGLSRKSSRCCRTLSKKFSQYVLRNDVLRAPNREGLIELAGFGR